MKKSSLSALVGIALFVPVLAQAQAYVGVSAGKAKSNISGIEPLSVNKDSDSAYKLTVGYQLAENWAIEGGYANFGAVQGKYVAGNYSDVIDAKSRALYFAAIGSLPVNDQFSLFGKLGFAQVRQSGSERRAFGATTLAYYTATASKTNPLFGFGAEYKFTKNVSAVFEYENFGKADDNWKIQTWTIGARYRF